MITQRQIRAARALLGWDAADLAEKAGLTRATLSNIENGLVQARAATIEKIKKVFIESGLEFLDHDGVRRRPENVEVLEGREGLISLMEEVYEACKQRNAGEIVISGVSEKEFQMALGEYDKEYIEKMSLLPEVNMRHLIAENDTNTVSSDYGQYRCVSNQSFKSVPFYVFSDKLAIILFSANPTPKIFVIQSREIAEAYRGQFENMWQSAKPVLEPEDAND